VQSVSDFEKEQVIVSPGLTIHWSGTEVYTISFVSKCKSVRSIQGR
jgi:hypothetical protein